MQRIKKSLLTAGAGITMTALLVLHTGPVRAGGDGDAPVFDGIPTVPSERPAQMPVEAQGMRVYRDPQTRRLGPPPPGLAPPGLTTAEQRMLSRSDQGL